VLVERQLVAVEQYRGARVGDHQIELAVVVVIGNADATPVKRGVQSGVFRYLAEQTS
jgi:hypothetical protein